MNYHKNKNTLSLIKGHYYTFLDHFYSSYTKKILLEAFDLLCELWPYLIGGIFLTTFIKVYFSKEQMTIFFQRRDLHTTIFLSALIGIITPVGSYVIIPMSAALLVTGVPLPALMSLMVASPIMNPNLFILTTGAMGLEMALLRTFAAFTLGVIAGYISQWSLIHRPAYTKNILRDYSQFAQTGNSESRNKTLRIAFIKELYKMTRYVSKYFFLAIIFAAGIKVLMNPTLIVKIFGNDNILSVIISTGAGIPFYVCGGAAIPVVQSLAELGMSKGAVLAYFISGPVTKISNLLILKSVFRTPVFIGYLIIGIAGAIIFGIVYNFF